VGKEASHLPKRILCVFWEEKEEDECVRENLVFMCGKRVVRGKNVCKQRA
jgi:hypothetical protein